MGGLAGDGGYAARVGWNDRNNSLREVSIHSREASKHPQVHHP
jgi:hypothetical protein